MDKINALFKSHRTRLHGLTIKTGRSTDATDAGHKSAPCTLCLQRDAILETCLMADLNMTSPRLAHLECAGSTPRLMRSLDCRNDDSKANTSRHVDCDCEVDDRRPGGQDFLSNGTASHHIHDVDLSGNDRSRRRRRQRSREQNRSSHRLMQRCTHIPGGLDKSWEACRLEGLEMLQHSVEQRRERRAGGQSLLDHQMALPGTTGAQLGVSRERSKSRSESNRCQHRVQPVEPVKLPELKVCIERRLVELTRQLAEERQKSRQDRLSVAKLQQELARNKSEHPLREMLIKELERERRLRSELESRLRDKLSDLCDCKPRLVELQMELAKTKEFSHSLIPYKSKFERLKEDHSCMIMNFEGRLETLQNEILHLTEENGSLSSELSRMQNACAGCQMCTEHTECRLSLSGTAHSDDNVASSSSGASDKTKVLLERLKMLETEKTCLVLENEKQCEQYEKCLDDITCQVLQALMSQRSLKEECSKLRVQLLDVQQQNNKLHRMLDQQSVMTSSCSMQCASTLRDIIDKQWPVGFFDDPESGCNGNLSQWRDSQSAPWNASSDLVTSIGSLSSMCSDQEQLQFVIGRLSSVAPIDFTDVEGGGPPLSAPENSSARKEPSSSSPDVNSKCDEKTQAADLKDIIITGSTVSLNELLDSCMFECENNADVFADPDSAVIDPSGWMAVGDIFGSQWHDGFLDDPKSGDVSMDGGKSETAVSGDKDLSSNTASGLSDTLPDFLLSIRSCHPRSFPENVERLRGPSNLEAEGKPVGPEKKSKILSSTSTPSTASEHRLDDGYHSNATSATSPDVNIGNVAGHFINAR